MTPTDAAPLDRLNDLYRARAQAQRRGETLEVAALTTRITEVRRAMGLYTASARHGQPR